jgi:hypothetical protein
VMNEAYLVVDWAEVNIRFEWFSGNATGKHVLSGVAEPVFDEDTGHIFDLDIIHPLLHRRESRTMG